ncbi:hypothetical protein HGRIS_014237 [Hohenbuehelia grisea]|uniref:Transmembrane protein n=1 Tax=Hohenbuehelia grisea TaxID=104357 RepID=A0ABR3JSY5_9AGAR
MVSSVWMLLLFSTQPTLSLIAAFAFAAFVKASPMPAPEPAPVPQPATATNFATRDDVYQPLPAILQKCHEDLKPLCAELRLCVKVDGKVDLERLEKAAVKVKSVLRTTIAEANKCRGHGDILVHDGDIWTVKAVARLVCDVLELLFNAIWVVVLAACKINSIHVVLTLACSIADVVADLLIVVLLLVKGLLPAVLANIGKVAPIILCLGVPKLTITLGGLLGFAPYKLPA